MINIVAIKYYPLIVHSCNFSLLRETLTDGETE